MRLEDLNLAALKYFIDAVEAESLTEASAINFVTRPAISQAIVRLEQWVAFPLLKHGRKSFQLTPEGQKFYRAAKEGFENLRFTLSSQSSLASKIRVGCSISLADHFLIPILKKFGNIDNLELKAGTSKQLIRNLEDREINIALFSDVNHVPGFENSALHTGSFRLASRSGHLASPLVTTEDRDEVRLLRKALARKIDPSFQTIRAESWSLCMKLASQFGGTCLIPDILIESPLKPVSLRGYQASYKVLLVHPRLELVSEPEAKLIELMRANV